MSASLRKVQFSCLDCVLCWQLSFQQELFPPLQEWLVSICGDELYYVSPLNIIVDHYHWKLDLSDEHEWCVVRLYNNHMQVLCMSCKQCRMVLCTFYIDMFEHQRTRNAHWVQTGTLRMQSTNLTIRGAVWLRWPNSMAEGVQEGIPSSLWIFWEQITQLQQCWHTA